MSSSIKCFTTDRLLSRACGSSSDESEEVLGGRFLFFGVFGSLAGAFGLLPEPFGRPRGRLMGASAGAFESAVTESATAGGLESGALESGAAASALTSAAAPSKGSNTTFVFFVIYGIFF